MPRYFFEISDGTETLEDAEGGQFPDAASARGEAIRLVEIFSKRHAFFFVPNWNEWNVYVKQEKEGIVLSIPFTEACSIREGAERPPGAGSTGGQLPGLHASRPTWSCVRQAAIQQAFAAGS